MKFFKLVAYFTLTLIVSAPFSLSQVPPFTTVIPEEAQKRLDHIVGSWDLKTETWIGMAISAGPSMAQKRPNTSSTRKS